MTEEKFATDLDALDSEHDPSKVKFATQAPDGPYQARLDICRLSKSKGGNLQTFMQFEVVHGEHEGRTLTKFCQMSTPENLDYLTKDIWNVLGEKVLFKWKEVTDLYAKMLDTIVEVTAKTVETEQGEIQNVFINKRVAKVGIGEKPPKGKDTSLPF